MAENTENHSFSYSVLSKAVANTRMTFSSLPRDLGIGGISLLVGFCIYWAAKGMPDAIDQVASAAAFTFAPVGIILAGVFLWHLLLAPAELAYEETRRTNGELIAAWRGYRGTPEQAAQEALSEGKPAPAWEIWKQRDRYRVYEFAALLDELDPSSGKTTHKSIAYRDLLVEQVRSKKLKYIPVMRHDFYGDVIGEYTPDENTEIPRPSALEWATACNFNVSNLL